MASSILPNAELPNWDLTDLYSGQDDPRIEALWASLLDRADRFAETYRGKIDSADLDAARLSEAIGELEAISQELAKPYCYAELCFAADTSDAKNGAFLQKQMEYASQISVKLMFFELELQKVNSSLVEHCLADSRLSNFRHYIQLTRAQSPHRLSEPEEIILEESANTGVRAWVRLFEEVTSNHVFKYQAPGSSEVQELSQEEILDLFRDPSRDVRQAAADGFSAGLMELQRVVVFIYNNLLQDKKVSDRLRKHPYPEHSRHLSNELDQESVDVVIRLCRENYPLVSRFYQVKKQILGLPALTHIDRYAPLFEPEGEVSWDQAKEIVLRSFAKFSPTLASKGQEFFDEGWIDAAPKKGKSGGAFCMSVTPDTHPFILQTYLGKMDDVMTLAHELGHGVHGSLSRAQTYINFHSTLPLAELASTFGEMLVFESITEKANLKDRLALYAEKIEGIFATVFRQAAMFQFEQACHEKRRSEGELTAEQFGDLWHEKLQEMFGESITLGEQHRDWWSYIGHFFFAPFYVYAYSFGELLALSLFAKSKTGGEEFEKAYVRVLELGGSLSPHDLMSIVSVDLRSEEFWKGGFAAMEQLVEKFEGLWAEYSASN